MTNKNLYQRMAESDPERNPICTAIDKLKNPEEIRKFVEGCTDHYKQQGGKLEVRQVPGAFVKNDIGYFLQWYDPETAQIWVDAIGGIPGLEESYLKVAELGDMRLKELEARVFSGIR